MRTAIKAITETPVSLHTLMGDSPHCDYILMETPAANAAVVNFGGPDGQPATLAAAGEKIILAIQSLKNVWVKGTTGDDLIIMVW